MELRGCTDINDTDHIKESRNQSNQFNIELLNKGIL